MMHTVSLVMIVRNEARCIERCLASARPWVDGMVVLDTGSTDDTVQRAEAAGARVHHAPWTDDFSQARNTALSLSDADWNLVLDADEWITSGGPVLRTLRERAPSFVGAIKIASSYPADAGPGLQAYNARASSWISRVLPRKVRYQGLIHEQPFHGYEVERLPVHVEHDGYQPGQTRSKLDRNLRLLQAALSAKPLDPYLNYQLGKDHDFHGRFDTALSAYEQAYATVPRNAPYLHDLVIRLLFTLKMTGRVQEAIELIDAEMPCWQASADFFFTMGDILLDYVVANPGQALETLPMIEAAWLKCLELGDNQAFDGAMQGRGSYLAAHNLAVFYANIGEPDKAFQYRDLHMQLYRESRRAQQAPR